MDISKKKSVNFEFIALVGSAFILSYIPILNIPFTWIMTFFHEISHGIAAILTGGSVQKINIHINGSGLCYTVGGIRFFVLIAGYIGAVIWGMLIYEMADKLSHKNTSILAGLIAGLIAFSALFYGRDVITWIILIILFAMFASIIKFQDAHLIKLALKFLGIYVLLDAVRAPLHLIDGRHYGDGAKLADLTGLPEIIWIILWLAIGIGGLILLWQISKKYTK